MALVGLGVVCLAYTVLARGVFGVWATPPRPDPTLQILRERLARVEIDPDDYERRLALAASEAGLQEQSRWPMRLFRLGFAGVFLINALVAVLQPQDFLLLLKKSLATNWFPAPQQLIPLIALNDLAIAVVIRAAPRRYRPYVYAWTGLWFLAITVIKLLALNIVTG